MRFAIAGEITEIAFDKIKTDKLWERKYSEVLILKKDNTYLIGREIQKLFE